MGRTSEEEHLEGVIEVGPGHEAAWFYDGVGRAVERRLGVARFVQAGRRYTRAPQLRIAPARHVSAAERRRWVS